MAIGAGAHTQEVAQECARVAGQTGVSRIHACFAWGRTTHTLHDGVVGYLPTRTCRQALVRMRVIVEPVHAQPAARGHYLAVQARAQASNTYSIHSHCSEGAGVLAKSCLISVEIPVYASQAGRRGVALTAG